MWAKEPQVCVWRFFVMMRSKSGVPSYITPLPFFWVIKFMSNKRRMMKRDERAMAAL